MLVEQPMSLSSWIRDMPGHSHSRRCIEASTRSVSANVRLAGWECRHPEEELGPYGCEVPRSVRVPSP